MSWWRNGNNGGVGGNGVRGAQHDMQLRLAPPAGRMEVDGGNSTDSSSPSSCVTSDSSPSDRTRMLIGVCTQCSMRCMVSMKEFPTCVNCKQPCLVDVFHGPAVAAAIATKKRDQRK